MKNRILIVGLLVISLLVFVGCGKKATFGEGDTKFSVDVVKGECLIHDNWYDTGRISHKYTNIEGSLELRLCNLGERELPFVLEQESGGVLIKFKEEDIRNVKQMWLNDEIRTMPVESTDGFINLVPDTCPTYPFIFESSIQTDPTGEEGGFSKEAFKNAECYFYIGDKEFKLKTTKDLTMPTAEDIQKIKDEEANAPQPVMSSQLVS